MAFERNALHYIVAANRQHASRVWTCAIRLKEQCQRLGLACEIIELFSESDYDLREMENASQIAAKRISNYTGILAESLEQLIDQVEAFGCGGYTKPITCWQY